ncbi:hypothetical protein DN395_00635 [Bacillus sp. AR18-7]|nr:hypothetical protein DN395_00635 [Bacillus sp. AR18-7]
MRERHYHDVVKLGYLLRPRIFTLKNDRTGNVQFITYSSIYNVELLIGEQYSAGRNLKIILGIEERLLDI